MRSVQTTAVHLALKSGLESLHAAGGFRLVALADGRGLAWGVVGDTTAPDTLASVPSLVDRGFADKQPLLRFFSNNLTRFEYHSDCLAFIKNVLQPASAARDGETPTDAAPANTVFSVDIPSDKDAKNAREFIVDWGGDEHLVARHVSAGGTDWHLIGITANPSTARAAMRNSAGNWSQLLSAITPEAFLAPKALLDGSLHDRMMAALEGFQAAAPGIQMAAVTSKDGFVVASLEGGALDPETVAPLMGHAFLAIQESTQRMCGATETVMLRMEEGVLVAGELTEDLLFAALLAPEACTGLVLSSFESAATALRCALDTMAASVSAPRELEVAA